MMRWAVLLLVSICTLACGRPYTSGRSAWWQGFRTRYNTLFNAQQAYDSVRMRQLTQSTTTYRLGQPLDIAADTADLELYQAVWQRCERAIQQYSLRSAGQRRGQASRQNEYNPAMHRAWRLLGESLFYAARYADAAEVFAHISQLYAEDLELQHYARLWQLRSLVALGEDYRAERVAQDLGRLPIYSDKPLRRLRTLTEAEQALSLRAWAKAIPLLQDYLRQPLHPEQEARAYYALALAYDGTGAGAEATRYYQEATRYTASAELRRIYGEYRLDSLIAIRTIEDDQSPDFNPIAPKPDSLRPHQSDTIYPIDWGRIYASEGESIASRESQAVQRLELVLSLHAPDYGQSELLFLLSSYNFKQHTQQNIRLELSPEGSGRYRLLLRGFVDRGLMQSYSRALERYLSVELGLVVVRLD